MILPFKLGFSGMTLMTYFTGLYNMGHWLPDYTTQVTKKFAEILYENKVNDNSNFIKCNSSNKITI